jgi:hypothetical protein
MELTALTAKQAATVRLSRQSRIAVWEGAVRSGKTIVSLIAWADFLMTAPPGPLLMAGRTTDTLRRNCVDPLTDLLGAENVRVTWGDGRATILGRQVHLVGADNTAAETRIRGLTLAGAYVDELTIIGGPNGRQWWQMLQTRMSVAGARVIATTNPGSPSHWLLEDYLTRAEVTVTADGRVERDPTAPDGMRVHRYRFVIDDNVTLPAEYVAAVKASLQGLFYKRFIDGLWVAAEGAVYPMLDVTPGGPHVAALADVPVLHRRIIGIDHGTTNPTHAVALGVDAAGVVWVTGEYRLTDPMLTPSQQAERVSAWVAGHVAPLTDADWDRMGPSERVLAADRASRGLPLPGVEETVVVVDPAARGFRNAWHGVTGRWPRAADNAVLPGISEVASLLGAGRLRFVDGACPVLLRELSGYAWDAGAQARGVDAPVKKDDHGPDALRYAVRGLRAGRSAR